MTLNGSGIRDITRVLGVSINTVLKQIRLESSKVIEEKLPNRITEVEMDEIWSFVEKKENQVWLWYSFDAKSKKILAWVTGPRTDQSCQGLLEKLKGSKIMRFCTDAWESYEKLIDSFRHWIGKQWTQNIERNNLNFRTRLKRFQRRTICFSKSERMHDAVLKLFIQHFNHQHHKF
jgi:insertion element IS1 protein InsB